MQQQHNILISKEYIASLLKNLKILNFLVISEMILPSSSKRKYGNENDAMLKDLFLCTYNVRTLSKDHHLESLLHEIKP